MTLARVVLTATLTAYSFGDGHTPGRITASGEPVQAGRTVAADPRHHPAGTRLWIEGVGHRTVTDTGGAIKGHARFDLYLSTPREARAWGVQERRVVVLGDDDTQPPTMTPRSGSVPVLTVECSPTVKAQAQETPTPDEPTPSPLPSRTPTETPTMIPTYTATPWPSATYLPWPTDTEAPATPTAYPTYTPYPTQTPWIVVVTATPDGLSVCITVRGRALLPWVLQRRPRR